MRLLETGRLPTIIRGVTKPIKWVNIDPRDFDEEFHDAHIATTRGQMKGWCRGRKKG